MLTLVYEALNGVNSGKHGEDLWPLVRTVLSNKLLYSASKLAERLMAPQLLVCASVYLPVFLESALSNSSRNSHFEILCPALLFYTRVNSHPKYLRNLPGQSFKIRTSRPSLVHNTIHSIHQILVNSFLSVIVCV